MRSLLLLLAIPLLSGCLGAATAEPSLSAGPTGPADSGEPLIEDWYLRAQDRNGSVQYVMLREANARTSAGGGLDVSSQPLDQRFGPYDAEEGSAGFPAGSPVSFGTVFSCHHPAIVTFRLTVGVGRDVVADLQQEVTFVGTFFPVAVLENLRMEGTLSAAVPPGSLLWTSLETHGCAAIAMGTGGEWSKHLVLGPAR